MLQLMVSKAPQLSLPALLGKQADRFCFFLDFCLVFSSVTPTFITAWTVQLLHRLPISTLISAGELRYFKAF